MRKLIRYLSNHGYIKSTPTWVLAMKRLRLSFHPWSSFFHAYFNTKDCDGQYYCLTAGWGTVRLGRR